MFSKLAFFVNIEYEILGISMLVLIRQLKKHKITTKNNFSYIRFHCNIYLLK